LTLFWFLTVCLFTTAALFVLVPLWRQSTKSVQETAAESRRDTNIRLFHERRNELEAELSEGLIAKEQFDALLLELQQGLLTDVDNETKASAKSESKARSDNTAGSIFNKAVPIAVTVLIPIIAYGLYFQWGSIADIQLTDLYERTVNNVDDPEEASELVVSLGNVVQADADNHWAWYFLGINFANIGMMEEAEIAFMQSSDRMEDTGDRAVVLGRYAQIKYINSEFQLTDEVRAIIDEARDILPTERSSLELLALEAEQKQDYPAAIQYWRLLIQGNPNSEMANTLRTNIAAAQQIIAASSEEGAGPVVDVNITLADGIELPADLSVFVAARNAEREGMPPLAADRLSVADLPITVKLDNSLAVGPFNLGTADTIYVSVLVSQAGIASPQSGDYRVVSENFAHNGQHAEINLVVAEQVP